MVFSRFSNWSAVFVFFQCVSMVFSRFRNWSAVFALKNDAQRFSVVFEIGQLFSVVSSPERPVESDFRRELQPELCERELPERPASAV